MTTTETTTTTPATGLRGDEDELYRTIQPRLLRTVARWVHTDPDTVEDACQRAWTIMLRRQPDRDRLSSWMTTVAIREAIRLDRAGRRELAASGIRPTQQDACAVEEDFLSTIPDPREQQEIWIELMAVERCLQALPERKRRILMMRALGFSYAEIAEQTGDTVRTVDRLLRRADEIVELHRLLEGDHPEEVLEERLKPAARAALRRAQRVAPTEPRKKSA